MKGVTLTTIPLPASASYNEPNWISRIQDTPDIVVMALVYADQTGTLYLDQSDNAGTSSSVLTSVSVSAGVAAELPWTKLTKGWYRLRFVNSTTAQTSFKLIKYTTKKEKFNQSSTLFASAARTTTQTSADQINHNGRSLHVVLDVTAVADTPSIVPKIEGKDPASGKYYTLLEGAAVTGTGTYTYKVAPWIAAVANVSASDMVPRTWRVTVTHADADSITYSVGFNLGV